MVLAVPPTMIVWTQSLTSLGLTDQYLTAWFAFALFWFTGFWVLWVLTQIEWLGIRLIGRQRQWRITKDVAASVCAHASIGWIGAGVLGVLGFQAGLLADWERAIAFGLIGVGAGLLVFETCVYLGIRACRFANVERSPDE